MPWLGTLLALLLLLALQNWSSAYVGMVFQERILGKWQPKGAVGRFCWSRFITAEKKREIRSHSLRAHTVAHGLGHVGITRPWITLRRGTIRVVLQHMHVQSFGDSFLPVYVLPGLKINVDGSSSLCVRFFFFFFYCAYCKSVALLFIARWTGTN